VTWSNNTVRQAYFQPSYLKEQFKVPWILLTTQTNLGKFTVARPFSRQGLRQTVGKFCQRVIFFTFLTNDANF